MADARLAEYRRLVENVRARAEQRPFLYTISKLLVVLLGHVVMFGPLVLLCALAAVMGWCLWVRIGGGIGRIAPSAIVLFLAVLSAAAVCRSMLVRLPVPRGLRIPRQFAPRLFAMLGELKTEVGGPRVNDVVLNDEPGASMHSRPPFGLFGPVSHSLVLGVPLMAGTSTRQLRTIVAHEFSHMVGVCGRLDEWLFRTNWRWEIAAERGRSSWLGAFMGWLLPHLAAHAHVASRLGEQAADEAAVRADDPRHFGDALVRTVVVAGYLEQDYWRKVYDRARELVTPPSDMISKAVQDIRQGLADANAETAVSRALRERTEFDDTHMCIADRLARIGWPDPGETEAVDRDIAELIPPQPDRPALDEMIDPAVVNQIISEMDQVWVRMLAPQWVARHSEAERSRREIETWSEREPTTADELMRVAQLHVEAYGAEESIERLDRVLQVEPGHPKANFILGEQYVVADDPRGESHLEAAAAGDLALAVPACELLYGFHRSRGDLESCEQCRTRIHAHEKRLIKAHAEMARLSAGTTLAPHHLDEYVLGRLRETVSYHPEVKRMYVCKFELSSAENFCYYVVGADIRLPWTTLRSESAEQKVCGQLSASLDLEATCSVYPLRRCAWLARKMKRVENSLVYEAGRASQSGSLAAGATEAAQP